MSRPSRPDLASRERAHAIAMENINLARWCVNRFRKQSTGAGLDEDDLLQEAYLGLYKAALLWDQVRPFSTLAVLSIRCKIAQTRKRLARCAARQAVDHVVETLPASNADRGVRAIDDADQVETLLGQLKPVPREIIEKRFGLGCDPMTLAEIARGRGCCRQNVNNSEHAALRSLRGGSEKSSKAERSLDAKNMLRRGASWEAVMRAHGVSKSTVARLARSVQAERVASS